ARVYWARLLRKEPYPPDISILTVYLSTTVVLRLIGVRTVYRMAPTSLLRTRSRLHLTSSAVISLPLWNLTPWRRLKVQLLPPSSDLKLSARTGSISSLALPVTSGWAISPG